MLTAHIIEIEEIAAGVIVATHSGFRFFAAEAAFQSLHREVFRSIAHVNRAVRDTFSKRHPSFNPKKGPF